MIPAAAVFVSFTGDGTTTSFSFNKRVYQAADLKVYTYDATTDDVPQLVSSGVTTTVADDYGSATCVFATAPASGVKVGILRQTALTQDIDISDTDYVAPSTVEKQLDRQVMMAQEAALFAALGLESDPFDFTKSSRANKVAAFDDDGNPTVGPTTEHIDDLADISDDISAVAAITTAVSTVAARDADIGTVADRDADIGVVADRDADIATVAARDADIGTVADNATAVATAADNIAAIIDAPTQAANAATSATAAQNVLNSLGSVMQITGTWDASGGSFPSEQPSGDPVKKGNGFVVSASGTVDGVEFNASPADMLVALKDDPATDTYAGNWLKMDFSDLVSSVAGLKGAITQSALEAALTGLMPKTGGNFTSGIGFGSSVGTSPTDVSKHIALWGSTFGIAVSAQQLNFIGDSAVKHSWYSNGVLLAQLSSSGLKVGAPTGDFPGAGKINATDYQINGASVAAALAAGKKEYLTVALGDETTAVAAGTGKLTLRMPAPWTLQDVRASLTTAQASGSILTVDINVNGTSILSTKLTIDNTEKTSKTAATAAVISSASLADDDEITIDVDQVGDGTAKGLKVMLIGTR
jgi:hypothetical protein